MYTQQDVTNNILWHNIGRTKRLKLPEKKNAMALHECKMYKLEVWIDAEKGKNFAVVILDEEEV